MTGTWSRAFISNETPVILSTQIVLDEKIAVKSALKFDNIATDVPIYKSDDFYHRGNKFIVLVDHEVEL